MTTRSRMSPVDTAWLRMDSPCNQMMITAVQIFDGPLDGQVLRALLQSHLLVHREFRSRVEIDAAGAWWVQAGCDLDQHLVPIGLPGAADMVQLQHLVGQLASAALDRNKPLWQMHWIDNFRPTPGARPVHVLIARIHHCIADGVALVGVLLSLTTSRPDAQPPSVRSRVALGPAQGVPWAQRLLAHWTPRIVHAIEGGGDALARALRAANALLESSNPAAQLAGRARQFAQDLSSLAFMPDDTSTSLKGVPVGSKAVAWAAPLPLAKVKEVSRALGCSINDVLMAAVAGAFRDYLLAQGQAVVGVKLRALIAVNLRPALGEQPPERLGNHFGLVPLLLPIFLDDPREQVVHVREQMAELKKGNLPVLSMWLLGAMGLAPRRVQRFVLDRLAAKASAVMTNVPGPREPLYMAGAALKEMMFWVPQSGQLALGVSVLSYNGGVQLGVMTDQSVCSQPGLIVEHFDPAFERLARLASSRKMRSVRAKRGKLGAKDG